MLFNDRFKNWCLVLICWILIGKKDVPYCSWYVWNVLVHCYTLILSLSQSRSIVFSNFSWNVKLRRTKKNCFFLRDEHVDLVEEYEHNAICTSERRDVNGIKTAGLDRYIAIFLHVDRHVEGRDMPASSFHSTSNHCLFPPTHIHSILHRVNHTLAKWEKLFLSEAFPFGIPTRVSLCTQALCQKQTTTYANSRKPHLHSSIIVNPVVLFFSVHISPQTTETTGLQARMLIRKSFSKATLICMVICRSG